MHNPDLTTRELDVINLMVDYPDETYNQLANRLCIARSTFVTHAFNIYRKLYVTSRAGAVATIIKKQLTNRIST